MATKAKVSDNGASESSIESVQPIETKHIKITMPNFRIAQFHVRAAEVPLVVHRFSAKLKQEMRLKMETGRPASSRKVREAKNSDETYNNARYIAQTRNPETGKLETWDGFPASALRCAMISACRLVGFKMTLAKLSVFTKADGFDKDEPQIPLLRIHGDPVRQDDMARVETGQPYVTIRAAYHNWEAHPIIRWDADQFTDNDIVALLSRVGMQVGLGEGRPDSKNSAGMGWGLFDVLEQEG